MNSLNLTKNIKKSVISATVATLLSTSLFADCTYELFTISSVSGTTVSEFIEQLTIECDYSVVITDPEAEKFLKKKLYKTTLKNLTIDEVLDLVLLENNLTYSLENNVLKISYLQTKTLQINYIISQRKGIGSTDITLSSQTGAAAGGLMGGAGGGAGAGAGATDSVGGTGNNASGMKIESVDELIFWEELDIEFGKILNRPEDNYKAVSPIINKNAGLVTVTATAKQLKRLEDYLSLLQNRIQRQVLIDVQMLSVTLDDSKTTGVDWAQLYALQNFSIKTSYISNNNVAEGTDGVISAIGSGAPNAANLLTLTGSASIDEVVKFLQTQGDVHALSNPKVLTLNNQAALITVGTEFFYKISQAANQQGTGGGVASTVQNDLVQSVFAGVLLDITPEISDNGTITLKINPSISQARDQAAFLTTDPNGRTIPPDLDKRQLSSVVTVNDGARVIMGGLINTRTKQKVNKVPLLGDIPGLSYFFKYEELIRETEELIVIIEPHIVEKTGDKMSLADLGYSGITKDMLENANQHINNNILPSTGADAK